ncbi:MAG: serine hydrolase domain-containing protein, partial [bacterium]
MRRSIALLILFTSQVSAVAQLKAPSATTAKPSADELKLAGDWEGRLLGQLDMIFHIQPPAGEAKPWAGSFDVPVQNVKGFDLGNIVVKDNEIQFQLKGVPGDANFGGKLAADGMTIEGRFRQGILNQPLTLKKKQAEPVLFDTRAIDELANRLLADWKAPGLALAIVRDGKVIHAAGYGFKNVEKKAAMTADTLLAIGSCTKAFTTTLIAGLVDEGRLDWDRPMQSYWPEFRMSDLKTAGLVTLRDMVTHRTGLPRHDLIWFAGELPRGEIVRRIEHLPVTQPIRQKWIYNNLMFVTAAVAAERATGKSWEELIQARILDPL